MKFLVFLKKIGGTILPDKAIKRYYEIKKLRSIVKLKHIPCVGCGYCCLLAQCGVSYERYGIQITCPALGWDGKRYQCILHESHKVYLHIGAGCTSSLNGWRQNVRFRTLEEMQEMWKGLIPEKLWDRASKDFAKKFKKGDK